MSGEVAIAMRCLDMCEHEKILHAVDREVIDAFGFANTSAKLCIIEQGNMILNKLTGETDIIEQQEKPFIAEEVFGEGNYRMEVKLTWEADEIVKAEVMATPICRDAGKLWCNRMQTRIPALTIIFAGEDRRL